MARCKFINDSNKNITTCDAEHCDSVAECPAKQDTGKVKYTKDFKKS